MYERKLRERASDMADLADRNIVYKPLIWTSFGRPHDGAKEALTSICKRIARRRGRHADSVRKKMDAAISVCIARRAARMSLACFPVVSPEAHLNCMQHFADEVAIGD